MRKLIAILFLGMFFFATHSGRLLWGQCSNCDPDGSQQETCVSSGAIWYPDTCNCKFPCDPDGTQQAACADGGGSWDSNQCTCNQPPPPPCENYSGSSSYTISNSYCEGTSGEQGEGYTEYDTYTEFDTYDCYGDLLSSEIEQTGSTTTDDGPCEA